MSPRRVSARNPHRIPAQAPDPGARIGSGCPPEVGTPSSARYALTATKLSGNESKLLACLLVFYLEVGPGATPGLPGLDDEAGLERHELDEAVNGLRDKGLIEYWELRPAVRLTREGLLLAKRLHGKESG